jgi:hypothetical protein
MPQKRVSKAQQIREWLMGLGLELVEKGLLQEDKLIEAIPRERDKLFVRELVKARGLGKGMKEAVVQAEHVSHPRTMRLKEETAFRRGLERLDRPEVNIVAQQMFETAGLQIEEMGELWVQHIRGLEYEVDGVKVREKPSYQALKDATALVLPKAPTKFEGQVAIGMGMIDGGPPPFAGRALPEKRVKLEPKEDEDEA